MNWEKLKTFYYVAREKNISSAAKVLGLTPSALSKKISSLESDMGVMLLKRHVRGVELTPYGKELYPEIERMYLKINHICSTVPSNINQIRGHLRITSDFGFIDTWLGSRIAKFIKEFPLLSIEVKARNDPLDLTKDDFDVGISTQVVNSLYINKSILLTWQRKLYASPEYIEKNGHPKTIKDLDNHQLISFGEDKTFPDENMDWHLKIGCKDFLRRPLFYC